MPAGPVGFQGLASGSVVDEDLFVSFEIPAELVVIGDNVIAVEVHQSSLSSSDLSFDLEVVGAGYELVTPPPTLLIALMESGLIQLSWPAGAADWALHAAQDVPPQLWIPVNNPVVVTNGCGE